MDFTKLKLKMDCYQHYTYILEIKCFFKIWWNPKIILCTASNLEPRLNMDVKPHYYETKMQVQKNKSYAILNIMY